jgi:CheY-like chemotaxis protein
MSSEVLVAGFDGRSLRLEAPVLQREGHTLDEVTTGRALLDTVARGRARLLVLGPQLSDLSLVETIHQLRGNPDTRHVSILVLLPTSEAPDAETAVIQAGANAALRRPLSPESLEHWIVKLLEVPRRTQLRVPVRGQVVGVPRAPQAARFVGQSRNLSVNGVLLACQDRLSRSNDVELEIQLEGRASRLRALGRIVRMAAEVAWPYLGYGVEFLLLPPDDREDIERLVRSSQPQPREAPARIRSTIQREAWVYEILDPVYRSHGWQVEIRRGPRERWRPGNAGPFYVVLGGSPEAAYQEAKAFVERMD